MTGFCTRAACLGGTKPTPGPSLNKGGEKGRRIPLAFTQLLAAACGFVPSAAHLATAERRALLKDAVEGAALAGAAEWPAAAAELFHQCCGISLGVQPALAAKAISNAVDVNWPVPVEAWQRRKDLCGEDFA